MNQKCANEHVWRRVGESALKLAAICCLLVLALAPTKMLATEPENLAPAGTQLAFVRDDQIYLMNADGSGLIQLTDAEPGVANMDPAWSRDGQRLAFAKGTSLGGLQEIGDIWIMDADGSNVIQLTSGGYNFEPTWGPDDLTIVFTSRPSESYGSVGLYLINVDTGGSWGRSVLLDFPGYDAHPAWSPDGQTITFTSDWGAYDFVYDLWAMNSDGTDVRLLIQGPFSAGDLTYYFQSAWSPDGQSIAVVRCPWARDNCYPDSAIVVANAEYFDSGQSATWKSPISLQGSIYGVSGNEVSAPVRGLSGRVRGFALLLRNHWYRRLMDGSVPELGTGAAVSFCRYRSSGYFCKSNYCKGICRLAGLLELGSTALLLATEGELP